ncbi:MAG: type I 3-dehydroquinate dehydratase [Nitrospirota bacterium]
MERCIGTLPLGTMPLIAGALTDSDVVNLDRVAVDAADILELRVDMFDTLSPDHIEAVFKEARDKFRKPLLATIRAVREGGQKDIEDRTALYQVALPLSDAADVEVYSDEPFAAVKALCVAYKKPLIGSYHNFEHTPDDCFLDEVVAKGKEADIVKIAAMANEQEDMVRLALFTFRHRERGMITMSMGDRGLPSRVFNPLFGSLMTYGYVTRPSAPGQLSIAELADILRRLKLR